MISHLLLAVLSAQESAPTWSSPAEAAASREPLVRITYPLMAPDGGPVTTGQTKFYVTGFTVPGSTVTLLGGVDGIGAPAQVFPNGAYVGQITLAPGPQTLVAQAVEARGSTQVSRAFQILSPTPEPTGVFLSYEGWPNQPLGMEGGELFEVSFSGSPGGAGRFKIRGLGGWRPAAETSPGSGQYGGAFRLPQAALVQDAAVDVEIRTEAGRAHRVLPGTLSVRPWKETPRVVRLKEDTAARGGPGGLSMGFLPSGTLAEVAGFSGKFLRLRVGRYGEAWISSNSVEDLPPGSPPPSSWLSGVEARVSEDGRRERIILDLGRVGPHWFRHDPAKAWATLDIPGARMDPYQIHKDADCRLIQSLDLTPLREGEGARLNIQLSGPIWGWRTRVEGKKLVLELKKIPGPSPRPFQDFKVLIDPGHGGMGNPWCFGACNPFGYPEKHANLGVGLALKELLAKAGAVVRLTREDDRDIRAVKGFEAVSAMIREADPDLYLAIHHNGVAETTDPRTRQGRETFWLFPHQRELAEALAKLSGPVTTSGPSEVFGRTYFFTHMTDPQSALVEVAYMGHPLEGASCQDPSFQREQARAIFKSLESHLRDLRANP